MMCQTKPSVLFVDDEEYMLDMYRRMITQEAVDWDTHFCSDAESALSTILAGGVDAVVSDIRMPRINGFELLSSVRESDMHALTPFIILTGDGDSTLKRRALDMGASDLLTKPVARDDLLAGIRSVLRSKFHTDNQMMLIETLSSRVEDQAEELQGVHREVVWRLAKVCECRDDQTGYHIVRTAYFSRFIAEHLGLQPADSNLIFLASSLHDIGKIGIPDRVLLKPGLLDVEERQIAETHAEIGFRILSGRPTEGLDLNEELLESLDLPARSYHDPFLKLAALIAKNHHERWDGSGYPEGLKAEDIPLAARIVAVADVYDALISERSYKPAMAPERAKAVMEEEAGKHFDPTVIRIFLEHFDEMNESVKRYIDELGPSIASDFMYLETIESVVNS
jgi:response regulator RpfG family c-di-GMP phosphodiesterase